MFLAGDPAQSIMEGTDFRFEEVMALVHRLSGSHEALQRPSKLSVNFRSYSGILNCAAAVLSRLLHHFPGAASSLGVDKGLFSGPRPVYRQLNGAAQLVQLLQRNERMVVICTDDQVSRVQAMIRSMTPADASTQRVAMENEPIDNRNSGLNSVRVLGIRAAKGLEFTDVILIDFFSTQSSKDYKAWKQILNGASCRSRVSSGTNHPHLEPQLELLYTAITLSVNRLLFLETRTTYITSMFFRWLRSEGLADALSLNQEEHVLMTSEVWHMRGINFSITAADAWAYSEEAVATLNQAVHCFKCAQDEQLLTTANVHLEIVLMMQRLNSMESTISAIEHESRLSWYSLNEMEVQCATLLLRGLQNGLYSEAYLLAQRLVPQLLLEQQRQLFLTHILKGMQALIDRSRVS